MKKTKVVKENGEVVIQVNLLKDLKKMLKKNRKLLEALK
jgi:hypothetical protein